MSLLMDALKKAERAKQADAVATSPGGGDGGFTFEGAKRDIAAELGIEPLQTASMAKAPAEATAHAATPVASSPLSLEPLTDTAAASTSEVKTGASPPLRTAAAPQRGATAQAPVSGRIPADRIAAKGVFDAKRPARGSISAFHAILGVLLLAIAGAAVYFWLQLRPPTPLPTPIRNAAPAADAAPPPPASAGSAIPAGPAGQASLPGSDTQARSTPLPAPPAAPGAMPRTEVAAATVAEAKAPVRTDPTTAPATARPARNPAAEARESRPARAERGPGPARNAATAEGGTPVEVAGNLRVTRDRTDTGIDPGVVAGYAALDSGDIDAARASYARALQSDPTNRDALLGMAAVASRGNRADAAEGLYQRVLELYPRDGYARAQLTALRASADPVGAESRVKGLIAQQGDPSSTAPLQFTFGNQMAAQGRWPEAQQAYFAAFAAEPDNPDYCYNLAVSLDQMRQVGLAHEYYAKALALAQVRRAGFDQARAKTRIEQLAAVLK